MNKFVIGDQVIFADDPSGNKPPDITDKVVTVGATQILPDEGESTGVEIVQQLLTVTTTLSLQEFIPLLTVQ